MSKILNLKCRPTNNALSVDVTVVRQIMQMSEVVAGRQLYKMFAKLEESTHDKVWLTLIVNWAPKEGIPMTKMMPWLKLAERVNGLDDSKEGTFTLSNAQAKLIYKRLTNDEFLMTGLSAAFAAFTLDFFESYGTRPESLDDELMFDGSSPTALDK